MITYHFRSLKNKDIQKTDEPRKGVWIEGHNISKAEREQLVTLGFDEAILEDANDYFEVPRFEYNNGVNYLFTRCVVDTPGGELSTAPLLIALSQKHFLTVSHKKFNFIIDFAKGGNEKKLITTQKVKSIITIIESIANTYEQSILKIHRTMLRHFGNVENIDEADIKEFVILENTLTDYISALVPTEAALVQMLRRRRTLELHEDDVDLVEDLVQDFAQLLDNARSVLNTIQNLRSAHSSILANKLNTTMKGLTAVTIVLTIPTIIASIFGMNTWLPFAKSPLSFILIIALILIVTSLVIRWFIKSRWL